MKIKDRGIQLNSNLKNDQQEIYTYKIDTNTGHVFDILSNYLYQNKIGTVIRELSANAWDAHIDAKNSNKFEIHLPTTLNPTFKIRDYGTGLSKKEIISYYITYGLSKRRDSDDFIGSFGIGAASVFSYVDSYITISYYNGTKYTCIHTRSKESLPTLNIIGEEPTDEPNGLEVQIAVASCDIEKFVTEARNIFQWWFDDRPLIYPELTFNVNITVNDEHFLMCSNLFQPFCLMGKVAYPIDKDRIFGKQYYSLNANEQQYYHFLSKNIVLKFDIGDIFVDAARENLQYISSNTQKVIDKCKIIRDKIKRISETEIANCQSLWEARCKIEELNSTNLISIDNFEFNGIQYKNKIDFYSFYPRLLIYFDNRNKLCSINDQIKPSFNTVFAVNDLKTGFLQASQELINQSTNLPTARSHYYYDNYKYIIILDQDKLNETCDKLGINISDVLKLSDYYVKKTRVKTTNTGIIKDKVFEFNQNGSSNLSRFSASHYWNKTTLDFNKGGYYIQISNYNPAILGCRTSYDLANTIQQLKNLELTPIESFVGVKTSICQKFEKSSKWVEYWTYLTELFNQYLKKNKEIVQSYQDSVIINSLGSFYFDLSNRYKEIKNKELREFCKRIQLTQQYKQQITKIRNLVSIFKINIKPETNISEIYNDLNNIYQLENLSVGEPEAHIHLLNHFSPSKSQSILKLKKVA